MSDQIEAFAAANKLRIADKPFTPYRLAALPPLGGVPSNPNWPFHDEATCLLDRKRQPACIVIQTFGGNEMRRMGELVHWLKLETYVPPAPHEDGTQAVYRDCATGFR